KRWSRPSAVREAKRCDSPCSSTSATIAGRRPTPRQNSIRGCSGNGLRETAAPPKAVNSYRPNCTAETRKTQRGCGIAARSVLLRNPPSPCPLPPRRAGGEGLWIHPALELRDPGGEGLWIHPALDVRFILPSTSTARGERGSGLSPAGEVLPP